jgi:hypothetical protein
MMESNRYLKGQRILYIDTNLFDYYLDIKKAMEKAGAIVDYLSSSYSKIKEYVSLSTNPKESYFENILNKFSFKADYDYVWVKPVESIPFFFLERLRMKLPRAVFISYHWHPIRHTDISLVSEILDRIYSFDRNDCLKNPKVKYLPLFYTDEFRDEKSKSAKTYNFKYDITFVGNALIQERNIFLRDIEQACQEKGLEYYGYRYATYLSILREALKGKFILKFTSKRLNRKQIANIFKESKCVIDFVNPLQSGLSMRTFETLGSGTKLLTTNKSIYDEPFYSDACIRVIEKQNPVLDKSFINNFDYSVPSSIENYSIHNWLKAFFNN